MMTVTSALSQAHRREAHISSNGKARSKKSLTLHGAIARGRRDQRHPPRHPSCTRYVLALPLLVLPQNLSRLLRDHMAFWWQFLAKAGSQEHFLILIMDLTLWSAVHGAVQRFLAWRITMRVQWGSLFSRTSLKRGRHRQLFRITTTKF
uniref:Uncharacterized protein n=1 Tax=Triticum urartu TaxID=4572 RepID=A0A8R7QHP0_TRIUA